MKVLLLAINARWTHTNLALYYLRQYVNPKKHTAQILEKTINDCNWDILREITEIAPDVLCLSVYIWNQTQTQAILRDIKKLLPNLIIVCGGPDISYNAENWLEKYPSIDYIIQGGGEKAFEALQENDFTYHTNIINFPNYHISDILSPYTTDDIPTLKHRYLYYEASRGCPFRCSYCISSNPDQKLQFKDFEQIKKELTFLLSFDPIIIKFIDRTFNINSELAISIWNFLSEIDTQTKFHFEIHPNYLTNEQLTALKKVKKDRFQFEIGIQTINPETLKLINRINTSPPLEGQGWSFKGTWDNLIHTHLDMIAGLPNETIADIKASFNQIIALKPDHFQLGFLKILPGTQIASETEKWGYRYQETAPYRVFSSNTISTQELYRVEQAETALELIYNSGIMPTYSKAIIDIQTDHFDYFISLGQYFSKQNISKATSDKKKLFYAVWQHLKDYSLFIINYSFLKDCLTYDWFLSSTAHFYPDFMDASQCDAFKSEIYTMFKETWQKEFIKYASIKPKLRNAIYFAPKNDKFRAQILQNADGAVKVDNHTLYCINRVKDNLKICKL